MTFSSASLMVDVSMAAMVSLPAMATERSQYTSVPVALISLTYLGGGSSVEEGSAMVGMGWVGWFVGYC